MYFDLSIGETLPYLRVSVGATKSGENGEDFRTNASLEQNPRSQNASLEELVPISIELSMSNVTNITTHIVHLLKEKGVNKFTKVALRDCLELYSDANSTLYDAMVDYKSGDYEKANMDVSSAMDASTTCEDGFSESKKASLESVPVSHATNLQGLAIIAIELALVNATNTIKTINKLLDDETRSFSLASMEDCLEIYSVGVTTLVKALEDFLTGKYNDARVRMSLVMDDTSVCEDGFMEKTTPLTTENYALFELCDIALCIVNLLSFSLDS
ncbi:hypothetical protein ACFE04_031815 [Oxalis oulophora]